MHPEQLDLPGARQSEQSQPAVEWLVETLRARTEPEWLKPLRGKSLTCWCKPKPESSVRCHAETLLRLANQGT